MFPLIVSVIFVTITAVSARADGGQAGAFLRQEPTARGAALSGALTAIVDDSSALYWNPAGLGRLIKPDVGGTHVTLFEDTSYDFLAGAFTTKRWGTFAAGYIRQTSGGFEARTGPNDAPTSFSITQSAVMAGWGLSFGVPGLARAAPWATNPKPFSFGLAVKQAKEQIASTSASGNGADIGLQVKPNDQWSFGAMMQNFVRPTLTYVSQAFAYPRAMDLSAAWASPGRGEWRPVLAVKASKVDDEDLKLSGGVEILYHRLLALRLGAQEKGMSTGVGIRFNNTSFDYAASLQDLGISHVITISQRFGQTREELEETIRRGISALTQEDAARLSKAYIKKADTELEEGKISEGLHDLESAALLDPRNDAIHERIREVSARWEDSLKRQMVERTAALAQRQYEQGNLLASRQYWKSVLEMDPNNIVAQDRLASIDRSLSGQERARLDELRAAQSKNEAETSLAVAQSYLERGQLRQAKAEAEKGLKLHPDDQGLVHFLPGLNAQIAQFAAGRAAEAEQLIAAKDFPGALKKLEGGLREDPGNRRLVELAANVRAQLSQSISPEQRKQVEQLYFRAVERYLAGQYETAGKLADEVLAADPSSESARALKDKVEAAQRYSK